MKNKYLVGKTVYGIVTGIEKYGIFLSFENDYMGLIHISELSENYVKDVSSYASIGESIPCVILAIDEEKKKIKCSIKNTDFAFQKDAFINHGFAPLKKQLPIWINERINKKS